MLAMTLRLGPDPSENGERVREFLVQLLDRPYQPSPDSEPRG